MIVLDCTVIGLAGVFSCSRIIHKNVLHHSPHYHHQMRCHSIQQLLTQKSRQHQHKTPAPRKHSPTNPGRRMGFFACSSIFSFFFLREGGRWSCECGWTAMFFLLHCCSLETDPFSRVWLPSKPSGGDMVRGSAWDDIRMTYRMEAATHNSTHAVIPVYYGQIRCLQLKQVRRCRQKQ